MVSPDCNACNGTGRCRECDGTGHGLIARCVVCFGAGKCESCGGTGTRAQELPFVNFREFFLENFAGDLEYHPRRATLYLSLGSVALCSWVFSAHATKFTVIPLVVVLGSLTLLLKGIFLLRKSSEGLALSPQEIVALSDSSNRKSLPSITAQAAQITQDFGTGAFLLWPLLNVAKDIDQSWSNPPLLQVFLTGAILFLLGWIIRRVTSYQAT